MDKSLPRNCSINGRSLSRQRRRQSSGTNPDYQHHSQISSSDNECEVNPYEAVDHRNKSTGRRSHDNRNWNQENPSVRQLSNSTRNISSSSMANRSLNSRQVGTKPGGGGGGDCNHHENDFEPSCLIRTPSGSLFIPSDYQTNTASPIHQEHSSPTHLNDHKSYNSDRFTVPYTSTMPVPVLPVRNDLRRPSTYTFPSSRFKFGKAVSKRCSWKCVAIVFILLFLALLPVLAYFIAVYMSNMQQIVRISHACGTNGQIASDSRYNNDVSSTSELNSDSDSDLNSIPSFNPRTSPPGTRAFQETTLGEKISKRIPSYSHWNIRFRHTESSFVRFNFSIPVDTSFGVYGRRNGSPSHTRYDFAQVLPPSGRTSRIKRYIQDTVDTSFTAFLDAGYWYISVYNDDDQANEIVFIPTIEEKQVLACPNDCRDHGTCHKGTCQCFSGYSGYDCFEQTCPELCSSHGEYVAGECHCLKGWKGKECNVNNDECEVADCNRQGECVNGKCVCMQGYKGIHCEEMDCMYPDCSNHGVCILGECICKKGWKGDDCSHVDDDALRCLPDCSGRGHYDLDLQQCVCTSQWTGQDCSLERCDMDCGQHGQCDSGQCVCDSGWTGYKCQEKTCDTRCQEHGQCRNGTCLCVQGWNGKHCTLEGCPNNCHGHGDCTKIKDEWNCKCNSDWDGRDCSIPVEKNCGDGIDNDKDGLTDCADSECCWTDKCSDNQMCITSLDPLDILLRKQPPAVTASFYQKMRFLIEEESVQSYAGKKAFNDSRASVIRGRVVSESGSGLVGIRVGVANDPKYGFTLTRDTGWFDLMVNGGGAVTLHFSRTPFKPRYQTVNVPWNEIVIIDQVTMTVDEEKIETAKSTICIAHDYDKMRPVVLATWKHGFQGGCPERSSILAESQVVQESIHISGSDLYLVYHSSRVAGYLSTIQLQLTPDKIPDSLRLVHLRISIEGILFEKTFEADPNIKFTYPWNRRNIYRQRVYGIATAKVYVGYEYNACRHIIWEVRTTTLSGHDMSISEIGGWNLNIHHRYNFHEGILQKGDGSNIYLKHRPIILLNTMGDGEQRPLDCFDCDGMANKQRLLAPVAIASGPDGSVYVGDFNLVRRINSEGVVQTIVELGVAQVPYRYHIAISPMDGKLYISDPEKHQIFRVILLDSVYDAKKNIEAVVGNGHKCVPGDKSQCGDGGAARNARLSYPKGIAISADNTLYIADGTNIRMVDNSGTISTLIGDHRHKNHWKPIPCEGTIDAGQVNLRWPTELAVNPLDGSLHVIDDHMILRVTQDKRLKVIAGRPVHCPFPSEINDNDVAPGSIPIILESPQCIAFSTDGTLYIAESDSQMINRVRSLNNEGIISKFAGADSKCSCLVDTCKCYDGESHLASTAKFNTISSIAVTPDGVVHICDQGNLRIRSVTSSLPEPNSYLEYKVYSPETQEVYLFNRFGQHISTQSILTGRTVYTFTYNVNTSFGKLSTVTDAAGNKIYILRDYSNQVNSIENSQGQKCQVKMSRMGMLQQYVTAENYHTFYHYHGSSGLIKSKTDSSSRTYLYKYDDFGRLTELVSPSSRVTQLNFDLSQKGASVSLVINGVKSATMFIKGPDVTVMEGEAKKRTIIHSDGSMNIISSWSSVSDLETVPYSLLAEKDRVMGETFPVPAKLKTSIGGITIQRVEWRYYLRREGKGTNQKKISQVGRKLRVNGVNLLNIEYDKQKLIETVSDSNNLPLLAIHYDKLGRPEKWVPNKNLNLTNVRLVHDRYGRLSEWIRGTIKESYIYDRHARLTEVTYSDGTSYKYKFKDSASVLPSSIILPSDVEYRISYDKFGSVKSVETPTGEKHSFYMQPSLGFNRFVYKMPGLKSPYVLHVSDIGKLVSKILPEDRGRVIYTYNNFGQEEFEICGEQKIERIYYGKSGLIKTALHTTGNNFESRMDFKYHSGIVKEMRHRFSSRSGMSNAKFKYQYEAGTELTGISGEIGGKEVPQLQFKTNSESKLAEKISQFGILYPKANSVFLLDDSRQYSQTRLKDSYGNLILCAITIKGKEVFSYEVKYNYKGNIQQIRAKLGGNSKMYDTEYMHTIDGQLYKVDGKVSWKYIHDRSGNVVVMKHNDREIKLKYDDGRRLTSYDDVELNSVDGRGFVVERGQDKFSYNAKGQLLSVTKNHHYGFSYLYDMLGRLISRKDHRGNITQFFYSNPNNVDLVTHIHYVSYKRTFSLFYDDKNFLLCMQQSSTKYYVANDHLGSPIAVFNEDGDIIKKIVRTPYGNIISDSNQELYIPVDFRGGIRDPVTGLIHYRSSVYDPLSMQWMTPQWEDLQTLISRPHDIHLYRFQNNDPVHLRSSTHDQQYFTELEDWMPLLGHKTDLLLNPIVKNELTSHHPIRYNKILMKNALTVVPGLSCLAHVTKSNFFHLSTIPKSAVKIDVVGKKFESFPKRIAAFDSFIGAGIMMSRVTGKAVVQTTSSADIIMKDVMMSVFNNSNFLDVYFSSNDKETFFFVKNDAKRVNEDMHQLQRLGNTMNVTKHRPPDASNEMELRVRSIRADVNIRYGTTPEQHLARVLARAKHRAIQKAWNQERESVRQGKQGRRHWTKSETEQLLKRGRVKGYEEVTVHNVDRYPMLADDPTNIVIQKTSTKARRQKSN